MIRQSSKSAERYRVRIEALADPTATVPRFALILTDEPEAGDWEDGSWEASSWDGTAAYALTPTISGTDGGATIAVADGCYDVWIEVTGTGGELPKRRVQTQVDIY